MARDVHVNVGRVALVKGISLQLLYPQEPSLPDLARSKTWLPSKASLCFLSFLPFKDRENRVFHSLFSSFFWQYFLPFAKQGINNLIEDAILRADKLGVKVISLAALNKVVSETNLNKSKTFE